MPAVTESRLGTAHRPESVPIGRDDRFDRIVELAAARFQVPFAYIYFCDAERAWIPSSFGFETTIETEYSRYSPFWPMDEIATVNDTALIPESERHPFLDDHPDVRFWCGAPIFLADTAMFGRLCIADHLPRTAGPTEAEAADLAKFAAIISDTLELRRELDLHASVDRERRLMNALSAAVAQAPTLETAFEAALEALCGDMGAIVGEAMEYLPGADSVFYIAASVVPGWPDLQRHVRGMTRTLTSTATTLSGYALETAQPLIVDDMSSLDAQRFPQAADSALIGVAAMILVPIEQGGRRFTLNLGFERRPANIEALASQLAERAEHLRPFLLGKNLADQITLLHNAVQQATDAVMITEASSSGRPKIVFLNPAFERLTGYSAAEVMAAQESSSVGALADPEMVPELIWKFAGTEPARGELICYRRDGSAYWMEFDAAPVFGPGGSVTHLISVMRDTTERREVEARLAQREASFYRMFHHCPVPMWTFDRETLRFTQVNLAAIEKFGWSEAEFLQMSNIDTYMPGEIEAARLSIAALTPETNFKGTRRYRTAYGKELIAEISSYLDRSHDREIVFTVIVDVTDRQQAEAALLRSRAGRTVTNLISEATLDALPAAVVLLDATQRMTLWNHQWQAESSRETPDGSPRPYESFDYVEYLSRHGTFTPQELGKVTDGITSVLRGDNALFEMEYPLRDGPSASWRRISITPASPTPQLDGAVVMYVDVTEARRAQELTQAAHAAAEAANQLKSQLLANTSHELRTPLNAIIGFSELLATMKPNVLTPKQQEYVGYIHSSGIHLLQLINDLLDLSKIEAGRMYLDEDVVSVRALVDECVSFLRPRIESGQQQLTIEVDPAMLLMCDPMRCKQILINLLSNAVKFTHVGGEIHIFAFRHDTQETIIAVRDTGIGMDETGLRVALEPFSQIGNRMQRPHEGTGLGLALVTKLMDAHDGRLEMDSEPGKGTEARIIFPPERTEASAL